MGVELREKAGSTEPCPVAGSREDKGLRRREEGERLRKEMTGASRCVL